MKKLFFAGVALAMLCSLNLSAFAADTSEPSDVENFTGTPGDKFIDLQWSAATDDTAVTGYKIYWGLSSVAEPGKSYDFDKDVGNVLEYKLTGLENGTKYYISVIAYDADANESIAWAEELAITPTSNPGAETDTVSPQVSSAEAIHKEQVKVVFSEAISLPSENAESEFSMENQETFEPLTVLKAEMDPKDATNKTVILDTEVQSAGKEYKLTVNIGIKDLAGNNIISGTSDTAMFDGSDKTRPSDDTTAPTLMSVEALDSTHVYLQFDEAVVLSLDPTENFVIVEKNDATKKIAITGVELGKNDSGIDNASVLITTALQTNAEYLISAVNITDMAENAVSVTNATKSFMGKGEEVVVPDDTGDDTTVPDDTGDDTTTPAEYVGKFMAKTVYEVDNYVVKLSWTLLADAKDMIASQKIYMSQGTDKNFNLKDTLGNTETSYEVKGLTAGDYWFKITTVDNDGVESAGLTSKKVIIAETGPGLLGLLLVSAGLGGLLGRKKKTTNI